MIEIKMQEKAKIGERFAFFLRKKRQTKHKFVKFCGRWRSKNVEHCFKLTLIGQIHQKKSKKAVFFNKNFENKY